MTCVPLGSAAIISSVAQGFLFVWVLVFSLAQIASTGSFKFGARTLFHTDLQSTGGSMHILWGFLALASAGILLYNAIREIKEGSNETPSDNLGKGRDRKRGSPAGIAFFASLSMTVLLLCVLGVLNRRRGGGWNDNQYGGQNQYNQNQYNQYGQGQDQYNQDSYINGNY